MRFFGAKGIGARRGETPVTLLALVWDLKRFAGNVITCQTLVDAGVGMKSMARRVRIRWVEGLRMGKIRTSTSPKSEVYKRGGDSGHKTVKCPG